MKVKLIIISIAFSFIGFSCEEDFLDEEIRDRITADNLYNTPSGFENGLNGLYALVRDERRGSLGSTSRVSGVLWWSSVDNSYNPINIAEDFPYVRWGAFNNAAVDRYSEFWSFCYRVINSANTIIDQADSPDVAWNSDQQRDKVIGTARLIRAWAYRHLIHLWGDVPLVLEVSGENIRTDWTRTPVSEILDAMEEDWLFAEEHLPEVHDEPGKVGRIVAQHYLAELYLMKEDYVKAEQKAQAAVDNPNYSLVTSRYGVRADQPGVPFMDQFYNGNAMRSQGNTEALWVFVFDRFVSGGDRGNLMRRNWVPRYWALPGFELNVENGGRGIGFLGITRFGLNLYEAADDRGSEFAIHRTITAADGTQVSTTTDYNERIGNGAPSDGAADPNTQDPYWSNNWPGTKKWDDGEADIITSSYGYYDQPYLRLAETYLLLAEAQHMQNKNIEAAGNINVVRERSNATPITSGDVSIDFILDERSRELVAEEHRRYTLLRLDKWIERTKLHNGYSGGYITDRDKLFPIPQDVIDANISSEFPQNTGYNE